MPEAENFDHIIHQNLTQCNNSTSYSSAGSVNEIQKNDFIFPKDDPAENPEKVYKTTRLRDYKTTLVYKWTFNKNFNAFDRNNY